MHKPLTPDLAAKFEFPPTPEQEAILSAGLESSTSLMVIAYAGCAKTTTLTMLSQVLPPTPGLALAFNVRIKKELEKRFPSHFQVMTLNGLGHRAWTRATGRRPEVDANKLGKLVTQVCKESDTKISQDQWNDIRRLASMAMQWGLVPSEYQHYRGLVPDQPETWLNLADELWVEPNEMIFALARSVLIESIKMSFAGVISYDDQIYMSTMFGGQFPKFPLVMVDESQDLSPLNHVQVKRTGTDRLIVVGDSKQAIYQFRGADSQSIAKLRGLRQEWIDLKLATTFRCPKSIVARHQDHAPGFTAFETNPEGQVLDWREGAKEEGWKWIDVQVQSRDNRIAVLCRNNAPLLSLAFKLLRQRIGVVMLGRDIGKGLIQLSNKILPDDETSGPDCARLVSDWMGKEIQFAIANDKPDKVASITDKGECLLAVLESANVPDAAGLRDALRALFNRETGAVTLSTGHRAKGLEWSTIVHLDPFRIPSRHARQSLTAGNPIPMEQEENLRYVIETRAQDTLILANLEHFQ